MQTDSRKNRIFAITCDRDTVYFSLREKNDPIPEEDCLQEQLSRGYHPAGYGFFNFKQTEKNGYYISSWECRTSCD